MRVLMDMCEILEDELKDIAKKGDISPTELDSVYKSVDIIKDIETIKAMRNEYGNSYNSYNSYDGSYDGSYMMPYSYRGGDGMSNAARGRDGDGDGHYSERRGRDRMGRYMSRDDGYSRSPETDQLRKEMEEMRKKLDQMH
jgi:hypothetical protein